MTPIINPWVFYWISILDRFQILFGIICVFSVIALGFSLLVIFNPSVCATDDVKMSKRIIKIAPIVFIISFIICTFIPSSQTITKMIAAQNVTYERVEAATDTVQTVYEDIMGLFKENKE